MSKQARPNPFLDDIYTGDLSIQALGGGLSTGTVDEVHAGGLKQLVGQVDSMTRQGGGAVVLLRGGRAGVGKSHLLARLVEAREGRCLFVPIEVNRDAEPSWANLFQGVMSACAQRRSVKPKVAYLDALCRQLMARGTAELILRGDVPSSDPAGSIAMLKNDYLGAFDVRGGGSDVGRWMVANFHALLPMLGEVLGRRAGVEADEAVAWLQVMAKFNGGSEAERKSALASVANFEDGAAVKRRLISLCRLAAIDRPLVLVFDHVDALAASEEQALELTCLIAELGRLRAGAGAVLAVNEDVWEASFGGKLPEALADRLTGREVRLGGLEIGEAQLLVRARLSAAGISDADAAAFLEELQLRGGEVVREVLRRSAGVWDRLTSGVAERVVIASEESVKDFVDDELPGGESLAEASTLHPPEELSGGGSSKKMEDISALLRELKARTEQFVPRTMPPSDESPLVGESDPADFQDDSSPLVRRFNEIRESMLQKPEQLLDLEAVRRMVSLAGERFPVVESSEFKMSPGEEPMVAKWVFPGNEILFGFEPEHQFRYWQSLIKLAGRRSESAAVGRLKLVVFSQSERPFSGAASIDPAELQAARGTYLDVIDLAPSMIASVIAADRVVCEMAKADVPMLPADAIRELAPQLDPLWRRITRPLTASGESEMSA